MHSLTFYIVIFGELTWVAVGQNSGFRAMDQSRVNSVLLSHQTYEEIRNFVVLRCSGVVNGDNTLENYIGSLSLQTFAWLTGDVNPYVVPRDREQGQTS